MANKGVTALFQNIGQSSEEWHTAVAYAFAAFDILNSLSDLGEIDQHDTPFQSVARRHGFGRPAAGHVARELSEYAGMWDTETERAEIAHLMITNVMGTDDLLYLFKVTARYSDFLEFMGEGPRD